MFKTNLSPIQYSSSLYRFQIVLYSGDMRVLDCCGIISRDLVVIGEQGYQQEIHQTSGLRTGDFATRFEVSQLLASRMTWWHSNPTFRKSFPKEKSCWRFFIIVSVFRLRAERTEFPGGICKIKCKADIPGGVWATSQSQVTQIVSTWLIRFNSI